MTFAELRKYVEARHGGETWNGLLKESGLGSKLYLTMNTYPDEETVALVTVAAILEDFGEFIVPDLVGMYHALI